jgi:cytochrome c-type biogenesis protein CcmH
MQRFVLVIALAGTAALGAAGCNKNVDSDAEMVVTGQRSAAPSDAQPGAAPAAQQSAGDAGPALEGIVSLSPSLGADAGGRPVLYLMARKPEGGATLAAQKITAPRFPLRFRLSQSDVMMQGFQLAGPMIVTARLDADGLAGPPAPGDWVGKTAQPVTVGGPEFEIVIDEAVDASAGAAPEAVAMPASSDTAEAPAPVSLPPAPPGDTMAAPQPAVEGTIELDPALSANPSDFAALFIVARSGEGGPPLAVKRIVSPTLPFHFRLTQDDVMMQGRQFQGEVTVTARLDVDGGAGPASSGDLQGGTSAPVPVGGPPITVVINERVP